MYVEVSSQICLWCLKTLVENNRPCPNCRRPYNPDDYRTVERKVMWVLFAIRLTPQKEAETRGGGEGGGEAARGAA